MWEKIKKALAAGVPVWQAWDAQTKQQSFRLWCAWSTFHLALCSVIALHFWAVEAATWTAIGFFGLCMVFYMLKSLSKAKVDLDDRSIELDSEADEGGNSDAIKPENADTAEKP